MVVTQEQMSNSLDGDQVVISGMSGKFPQAASIKELSDILYNKIDPITESKRWDYHHPEARSKIGQLPDLHKFDAQFFKVHYRIAENMEPAARILLEQTFHAVYDAGICPEELNGKKVSVYVGHSFTEMDSYSLYNVKISTGAHIQGWSKAMIANRISYAMNLKGPSVYIANACTSSLTALKLAVQDLKRGTTEAAFVCCSSNIIRPNYGIQYSRVIDCCHDGKTKSFDEDADGLARSDTITVFFLQRAKNAKRVYAEIVNVDSEYQGWVNNKFGFNRDPIMFSKFLEDFYKKSPVPAEAVEYVEALGSADPEVDKMELEVIDKLYCKNRTVPLPVGSVTSNIGWSEAASGASSIVKVLLGYHTGKLAGNLHCEKPRQDVAAVREGRLRILTDHHEFSRTYVAVNNLSIMGNNSHLLLKGFNKQKDLSLYRTSLPKLVTISGRIEPSITKIIEDLKSRPIDPEEIALLHEINSKRVAAHVGKGYVILDTNKDGKTVSLAENTVHFDKPKRPLWFVYSGMGSQWAGMGAQLMRIPIFAAAIERCRRVLEPVGVDIVHIITSPDKKIFDNILNSFVGIAAIQIGLTDVLTSVGIVPDMIIGHSVGELGCAYADGCFTAEEMILAAYSRGLVSVQTPFIYGSMAAVGLGYEAVKKLLPPGIFVACHNSLQSSTISGPADKMQVFVAELTAKGIFAKEVPCSNIAYHSKYIADAGPGLLKYLKEVIKDPKPRSSRWVSTSVPQDMWHEPAAALSSAEYHTNNLLNPVLFEETSRLIPRDAVLVEIAPHGLLQAILKRSLPESCVNIALTRRGHPDNTFLVLSAIGKLYMEGYYPLLSPLYPKVEFPVSTGTPMLSHLIEWYHADNWDFGKISSVDYKKASSCKYIVSTFDDENKNLRGNIVGGKVMYPIAAALVAVWDTLAMWLDKPMRKIPVEFSDVHWYSQLPVHEQKALKINVTLHQGNGSFEVMNGKIKVASGNVVAVVGAHALPTFAQTVASTELDLGADDIYKLFDDKGYQYKGAFRSLHKASTSLTEADVIWNQDWVTFLDGVLQLHTLNQPHDYISQTSYIGSVTIDYKKHYDSIVKVNNESYSKANVIGSGQIVRCGGVVVKRLKYNNIPFVEKERVVLKSICDNKIASQKEPTLVDVATLQSSKLGDVNSLEWVMTPIQNGPGITVNVHYAAICDLDAKIAAGVTSTRENGGYGMDFSGLTQSGARVMGLVNGGAVSSRVKAQPELLWPVPDHWTLEDAATVPSAYALAFYCLAFKTEFYHGMRILVHGGAGALGQAAISIALAYGAEVFTTVSNTHKKRFLLRLFPNLKEDHVGCSRNHSFADMVRGLTTGNGVDLVISCVKGDLKNVSLNCGAMSSVLLDLTQIPTKERYSFGMSHMTMCRNYVAVDFNSIFKDENVHQLKMLQQLMSDGIRAGYVRPLTRVTYAPAQTVRAFRLLAASNHRGRVLIRMTDHNGVAQPKFACSPGGSQLVVCAGALGTHWAERLVRRGAAHIVLHAPEDTGYLPLKIESWKKLGVTVKVLSTDLSKKHNVDNLLNESKVANLEGVYITAVGTQRGKSEMDSAIAALDSATRKLAPSLKYFSVVDADNEVGLATVGDRIRAGLPATFLNVSDLAKGEEIPWRNAVVAMERSLLSTEPAVSAHLEKQPQPTLLRQIAKAAELDIPNNYTDATSLKKFGLLQERVPAVTTFLNDVHSVALREDLVKNMTVRDITELEESIYGRVFKDLKGLERLVSKVNTDEMDVNTPIIPKKTLIPSANHEYQYDTEIPYLFILPGIESNHARFDTLCERLKIQSIVFNMLNTEGSNTESVEETVNRLAKYLLEKLLLKKKKNFYLLGYESSALIALELAHTLEQKGLTGTVFCLGGAPEEIQSNLNSIANEYSSEDDLQTGILTHISSLLTNIEVKHIKNFDNWDDKLNSTVKLIQKYTNTTIQYTKAIFEHAYHTLTVARTVQAVPKNLKSNVVILRAGDVPVKNLPAYSTQPIVVHNLSTTLGHVPQDLRCSAIINSHLSADILESYVKGNRCDMYKVSQD